MSDNNKPRNKGKFTTRKRFDHKTKRQNTISKTRFSENPAVIEHNYCKTTTTDDHQLPNVVSQSNNDFFQVSEDISDDRSTVKLRSLSFCRFVIVIQFDLWFMRWTFEFKECQRCTAIRHLWKFIRAALRMLQNNQRPHG
jgi:hypothetical protein